MCESFGEGTYFSVDKLDKWDKMDKVLVYIVLTYG